MPQVHAVEPLSATISKPSLVEGPKGISPTYNENTSPPLSPSELGPVNLSHKNMDTSLLTLSKASSPHKEEVSETPLDFSLKMKEGEKVREYQKELAEPGVRGENYIIVAPTGSGKTLVAGLVISNHLQVNQQKKQSSHVLFIVNTRPLAEQQKRQLEDLIPGAQVDSFTGDRPSTVADSIKINNISVCTAGKLRQELRKDIVTFENIGLMIFDECHHAAQGGHDYVRVMEHYLEYQEKRPHDSLLPQVVGMTASPGAGENLDFDEQKSINHLVNLAAYLNASSGYRIVTNNREELRKYSKNTTEMSKILKPPSRDNSFIDRIMSDMANLEARIPHIEMKLPRVSLGYLSRVQQIKNGLEVAEGENLRDSIGIVDLLICYSTAIQAFLNLRQEDALAVIEDHVGFPESDARATDSEVSTKKMWKSLLGDLKQMPFKENPQLEPIIEDLHRTFQKDPTSRALIFVPTRNYAYSLCDWLSNHQVEVKPSVITGHTNQGMPQPEQEDVLDRFRKGETNVLVATSVAEEGLDVPECNLVIRYQHVTGDIAQEQAKGRARAEGSRMITVVSTESRKQYRDLRNRELNALVDTILEEGKSVINRQVTEKIGDIQQKVVHHRRMRVTQKAKLRQSEDSKDIKLFCRRCKIFACDGSDIFLEGPHRTVPNPEFSEKISSRDHHDPKDLIAGSVSRTHKISCRKCGQDWGVKCVWKKGGYTFPVIKCEAFAFEIKGNRRTIRKWSQAPFEMKPLSDWLSIDELGGEEEQESDEVTTSQKT